MDNDLNISELVEQLSDEALAGKMVLLVGDDPEAVSERLGLVTEKLIDFGVELVRFDALQLHDGNTLRGDLCAALDVEPEHLTVGLRIRGQTGNPLLLVVDNSECLAADARRVIADIGRQAPGSLGIVFGGEADAEEALLSTGIPLALVLETHSDPLVVEQEVAPTAQPAPLQVPWRHLAAVLGLSLLAWLFWSAADEPEADISKLSLPERPATVIDTGDTGGETGAAESVDGNQVQTGKAVASATQANPVDASQSEHSSAASAGRAVINSDSVVAAGAEKGATESRSPPDQSESATPASAARADEPAKADKVATEPRSTAAAPKPTPPAAPAPPSSPALSGLDAELGYRHEDWLLAQDGSQWALQVAAASTEDAARILLDQLGRQRSAYYRARRDGRTLFIVLATGWQSREAALAGRDKLAEALRSRGPFPREMHTIHSEIIASR